MPNNWIKERGTGVHKRHLTRSPRIAGYLVAGLKLKPDTRYPTPYYKSGDGSVVIRHVNGNEYEIAVNEASMKPIVDRKVAELVKIMPEPDNI